MVAGAREHISHRGMGVAFGKHEHYPMRLSRALRVGVELVVWATLLPTKE